MIFQYVRCEYLCLEHWHGVFLVQGSSDSVRTCFIKFALSFLVAGDNEVVRNILELKSESYTA